MSLQTEIKIEMLRAGKSISDIAESLNMARPTLSRKLNMHAEFTYGEISKISSVLNVPASELIRRAELAAQRKQQQQEQEGDPK